MGRKKNIRVTTLLEDGSVDGSEMIHGSGEDDLSDFLPDCDTKRKKKRGVKKGGGEVVEEEGGESKRCKREEKVIDFLLRKKIRDRSKKDPHFKAMSLQEQLDFLQEENQIYEKESLGEPLRYRVVRSKSMSTATKAMILQKIDHYESLSGEENEYAKLGKWLKALEKIPFGKHVDFPVRLGEGGSGSAGIEKVRAFMGECTKILNKTIYGQERAKRKILEILAQRITNPESLCPIVALVGSAGVGKTTLIKHGVSRALGLPFAFTTLGGASDASYLDGHSYTYEGSTYGRVVEMLMEAKCMNPIFFFDELDKVSTTDRGVEIQNLLIHLTDSTQNSSFHDKYFSGVDLDVSKCILFFSLNDLSQISPILRDRLTIVEFDNYGDKDKVMIARDHLIPEICRNMGLHVSDYLFSEEVIRYVIEKCEGGRDDGVRGVKRGFERILMRLNYESLMPEVSQAIRVGVERPFRVERSHVDRIFQDIISSKEIQSKKGMEMMYV